MTTRSIRGGPAALAMLTLTAALLVPPARAADPATDGGVPGAAGSTEGWKKVLAFAHCAANVFRAVTPADWTVAVVDCTRLFLEEPPWPGGDRP